MGNSNYWKHSLNNWDSVDKDSLKFIFEQSDKYVKHTLDVSNRITDRAYSLVLFLFPLLSICVSALIFPSTSNQLNSGFILLVVAISLIISYSLYILLKVIYPRMFVPSGREPKKLMKSEYLENKNWSIETKNKFLYISEITNNQFIIDYNENQNSQRLKKLKCVFEIITYTLLTSIILISIYLSVKTCHPS